MILLKVIGAILFWGFALLVTIATFDVFIENLFGKENLDIQLLDDNVI